MSSAKRRRAVLLAAAIALLAGVVWLLRESQAGFESVAAGPSPRASRQSSATSVTAVDSVTPSHIEPALLRAADAPQRDEAPVGVERFDYEVELVVLDPLDLPIEAVKVLAGPAGLGMSEIGSTNREGRLVFAFRAFAPQVELDLALGGDQALIDRIALSAGKSELIRRRDSRLSIFSRRAGEAPTPGTSLRLFAGRGAPADAVPTGAANAVSTADGRIVFASSARLVRARAEARRRTLRPPPDRPGSVGRVWTPGALSGGASLRVRVRDATGSTVEAATVIPVFGAEREVHLGFTDRLGEYRFERPEGEALLLLAYRRGVGRARASVGPHSLEPVELMLSRADLRRVVLVDQRGRPLAHWRVWLEQRLGQRSVQALGQTDERGEFEFSASLAAPARVFASPSRANALPLEIPFGRELVGSEFTLVVHLDAEDPPAQAGVRVRGRTGLEDSLVHAWLRRLDSGCAVELDAKRTDDSEIAFVASGLLAGRYEFELRRSDSSLVRSGPFDLRPGDEFDAGLLEFALPARLRIAPRASARPGIEHGRLLARRGDFELASPRIRLTESVDVLLAPGDYRFVSDDLVESFGELSIPGDGSYGLRPDGVAERLGP